MQNIYYYCLPHIPRPWYMKRKPAEWMDWHANCFHILQTHTHTQPATPQDVGTRPNLSGLRWCEMVMQQWTSERRWHRARETEDEKERVKNRENEGDSVLSSFKTMWRGRLIWSLNGCCSPVLLLHFNTSPLTWIRTQTYACENTRWHPSSYTIHSYRCCTWVSQMCFPRISPLYTPPPGRIKEDRETEESTQWKTQGENEKRSILYLESKIGRERKEVEHKQPWVPNSAKERENIMGEQDDSD